MSDLAVTEGAVLCAVDGAVAKVTINRERRRNALDHTAVAALSELFERIETADIAAIVLTGQGTAAFCAGDDIKAYRERDTATSRTHFRRGLALMDQIADHPCLVIAAVEGYCVGGGLELAATCDYRIAARDATFSLPEVRKMGGSPTWGGLTRLPPLIGLGPAKRLVLLGEVWTGEEAFSHGLVDRVTESGQAADEAMLFASEFVTDIERPVFARAKRIMHQAVGASASTMRALNLTCEEVDPFDGRPD